MTYISYKYGYFETVVSYDSMIGLQISCRGVPVDFTVRYYEEWSRFTGTALVQGGSAPPYAHASCLMRLMPYVLIYA